MTDFKPGDRVHHKPTRDNGTVVEDTEDVCTPQVPVRWDSDGGVIAAAKNNLVLISTPAPRPLVGPAPTPPAAPRYVAPFRATGTLVRDATDSVVLEVNFIGRDTRNVLEFATYVATALNASVFTEE